MTEQTTTSVSGTHEEIMDATYEALQKHGYADLTMQDIADEAGKSKSLLHYHYDTKQGLLVAFLGHLLERFDEKLAEMDAESPTDRLETLVDRMLPESDDAEWERFHRALFELRMQAPYDEAYRERLSRNKTHLKNRFAEIIADGVASGEFREVDPDATARFILASLDGARSSRATLGDHEDQSAVREGLQEFVVSDLRGEE